MKLKLRGPKNVTWEPGEGLDPVTFTVRPIGITDAMRFAAISDGLGPAVDGHVAPNPDDGEVLQRMRAESTRKRVLQLLDMVAPQVTAWDGVLGPDDQPAPCTEANVRTLLGDNLPALTLLATTLLPAQDATRPNGSGAGYVAALPGPSSPAVNTSAPMANTEAATTSTA